MNPLAPADRSAFTRRTGFAPIAMSDAYIPLAVALDPIVQERLKSVSWIPSDAIREADAWIGRQEGQFYFIAMPIKASAALVDRPAWLDSPAKIAWWDDLASTVQQARMAFGAKQIAAGRDIMARAYADSAFWDRAYRLATAIANAPGSLFSALFSTQLGKLVLLGGVAIAAWKLGVFDAIARQLKTTSTRTNPPARHRRTKHRRKKARSV